MQILDIHPSIDSVYYDEDFIQMLESHLSFLKSNSKTHLLSVSGLQKGKYQGDFYGLLDDHKVEKKYHYAVMRFNNLTNSADYSADSDTIAIPDYSEIDILKSVYETSKG